MKIEQATLIKALSTTGEFIASRTTLPVLQNVCLRAKDDMLNIQSTNLEAFASVTIPCELGESEAWDTTVPGRLFVDLVSNLKGELIIKSGAKLEIICGIHKSTLSSVDAGEFPILPKRPDNEPIQFETQELTMCLENGGYCCGTDPGRPSLQGMHITSDKEKLYAFSADGFRASLSTLDRQGTPFNFTLPANFIETLRRILYKTNVETVSLYATDTQAYFEIGENTILISQLLEGNYPNVRQLVPTKHDVLITINAKKLSDCLKRLMILAKREDGFVVFGYDENTLHLCSESIELGTIDEIIECDITGEQYAAAFNGAFVREAIGKIDGDVCLEQNGKTRPLVIYPINKRDTQIAIVMPMALRAS